MWNAGMDEVQAGIKIAGRNINNLRYADDTTLMTESEEELKSLLMKVKEEREKAVLKLNIQKAKITATGPITSVQSLSRYLRTGKPGVLQPMGSQRVGHNWVTEQQQQQTELSYWDYFRNKK